MFEERSSIENSPLEKTTVAHLPTLRNEVSWFILDLSLPLDRFIGIAFIAGIIYILIYCLNFQIAN
jgi:hypothetical protein